MMISQLNTEPGRSGSGFSLYITIVVYSDEIIYLLNERPAVPALY